MEGGLLSEVLLLIKKDISEQIISTTYEEKDKREELYVLVKSLDLLGSKLQGMVNEADRIEENM